MSKFSRIYRELSIALDGLKKGVFEIAITTSENTHVAKLLFRIYELEKKLEKLHTEIGKTVYDHRNHPVSELLDNKDIREHLSRIKIIQQDIISLEKEINLLREEGIKSKLDELKQYMRRGGFTIDELIVEKGSGAEGKTIGSLLLPPRVIIISVIHHNMLIIPENDLQLLAGDTVFILSSRDRIKEVAAIFGARE
ncbi:MAG: TrkA C-terminal domain-containing protein [Nitrospira sp.]|nr:TrkA C-terminal domain-containing protein [Nitrospira sp.]